MMWYWQLFYFLVEYFTHVVLNTMSHILRSMLTTNIFCILLILVSKEIVSTGSVLSTILFSMPVKPFCAIVDSLSITYQSFAVDLQFQMSSHIHKLSK